MRYRFVDRRLEILHATGAGRERLGEDVTKAFLRSMTLIESVQKEMELYAYKGLRYEKLRGDRKGQRSIRLNKQWRLILKPDSDEAGNFLWILELVDYH